MRAGLARAVEGLRKEAYSKQRIADAAGGSVSDTLMGVLGMPSHLVGTAAGALRPTQSERELKSRSSLGGLAPGVGAYNQTTILKATDKGKRKKWLHELGGHYLGTLAQAGIGAAAGGALGAALGRFADGDPDHVWEGVKQGATAGAVFAAFTSALGMLAASVAAGVTPTRSSREQAEVDREGSIPADYLVPGQGTRNMLKRLGHGYDKYFEGGEADKRKPS